MTPDMEREKNRESIRKEEKKIPNKDIIIDRKLDFIESDKKVQTYYRKQYSQEVSITLGFLLFVMGLVGFVVPDLFNQHLSYLSNLIHFFSGVLGIWFGFQSKSAAKGFCGLAGIMYLTLGLLGYTYGKLGYAMIVNFSEDPYLWKAIPGSLELGSSDHFIHLTLGFVFIFGALFVVNAAKTKQS